MRTIPTPHEKLVDRCLELAGTMQDPVRHRRYLEGLNDRQLAERASALRADQQLRLPNGHGRYWGQPELHRMGRHGTSGTYGGGR